MLNFTSLGLASWGSCMHRYPHISHESNVWDKILLMLKSVIFNSYLLFINRLEGFLYFSTILRWCRYLKPCKTCLSNIMSDLLCSIDLVLQHEVNLFPLFTTPYRSNITKLITKPKVPIKLSLNPNGIIWFTSFFSLIHDWNMHKWV